MSSKVRLSVAIVMAILLPAALAFGRGGGGGGHGGGGGGHGGGGGGGHGGGGGGGHGGGGGGGHGGGGGYGGGGHSGGGGGGHGGGGHSSGGIHSGGGSGSSLSHSSGGNAGNFSRAGGSSNLGSSGNHASNHSSFMKNNFSSQHAGKNATGDAQRHQVNRISSSNFTRSSLNSSNSFVQKHNIADKSHNQWTHNNGKWNQANHNGNNWNNNWNHNGNWNYNHHGNNWWGWGWGGGWPWWAFIGLGSPFYGYNYYPYGYGNGFGYGYGAYNDGYATAYAAAPLDTLAAVDDDAQFADQGEADFKAGDYKAAARDWKHALVDDPQNGAIMMLLAQALLALGQYDEAAGATQAGMQMLPEDKWGVIVTNYTQLYGNPQDYNDQLKGVEKARDANPENPALRFLLGFHFGYLNYPKNAVKELDKGLTVAPKDLGAFKLRQIFAAKWPEAPAPPAAAVEAAKEAESQQPPAGKGPPAPAPAGGVETGSST